MSYTYLYMNELKRIKSCFRILRTLGHGLNLTYRHEILYTYIIYIRTKLGSKTEKNVIKKNHLFDEGPP
jgi:hypothetical protein